MSRTLIKITLSPATLARVELARRSLAPPGLEPLSRSAAVAVLVERGLAVTEAPVAPIEAMRDDDAAWAKHQEVERG